MSLALLPYPKFKGTDNNNRPLSGGLLYSYITGTTVEAPTYKDAYGTLNTNPIVLDIAGNADVWLDTTTTYRFQLIDNIGTVIWTLEDITAASSGTSVGGGLPISTDNSILDKQGKLEVNNVYVEILQDSLGVGSIPVNCNNGHFFILDNKIDTVFLPDIDAVGSNAKFKIFNDSDTPVDISIKNEGIGPFNTDRIRMFVDIDKTPLTKVKLKIVHSLEFISVPSTKGNMWVVQQYPEDESAVLPSFTAFSQSGSATYVVPKGYTTATIRISPPIGGGGGGGSAASQAPGVGGDGGNGGSTLAGSIQLNANLNFFRIAAVTVNNKGFGGTTLNSNGTNGKPDPSKGRDKLSSWSSHGTIMNGLPGAGAGGGAGPINAGSYAYSSGQGGDFGNEIYFNGGRGGNTNEQLIQVGPGDGSSPGGYPYEWTFSFTVEEGDVIRYLVAKGLPGEDGKKGTGNPTYPTSDPGLGGRGLDSFCTLLLSA